MKQLLGMSILAIVVMNFLTFMGLSLCHLDNGVMNKSGRDETCSFLMRTEQVYSTVLAVSTYPSRGLVCALTYKWK